MVRSLAGCKTSVTLDFKLFYDCYLQGVAGSAETNGEQADPGPPAKTGSRKPLALIKSKPSGKQPTAKWLIQPQSLIGTQCMLMHVLPCGYGDDCRDNAQWCTAAAATEGGHSELAFRLVNLAISCSCMALGCSSALCMARHMHFPFCFLVLSTLAVDANASTK